MWFFVLERLFVVLERFSDLKNLDLIGHDIGESMDKFINFSAFSCLANLETFIVSDCNITNDAMEYLVYFSSLKKLDLSENKIGNLGNWSLRDITGYLIYEIYFPNLETLILENNYIYESGVALLPSIKFLNF